MKRMAGPLVFVMLFLTVLLAGCVPSTPCAEHVISHRGAAGEETEHSFAAYDLAIGYGSVNIEQDIVSSAEGTLYVSHDMTAQRMTGDPRRYDEMTDAEIDALLTSDGQHILKLTDVFDRYGDSIRYIIEIRTVAQSEALVPLVREYGLEDHVTVQAWYLPELQVIERELPDAKRMLLVKKQKQLDSAVNNPTVQIIAARHNLMSEANCKLVHDSGKLFSVWTLDSSAAIRQAIELGVDSYFTNFTAKALYLEEQYRK